MVRDKSTIGDEQDKETVIYTIGEVLLVCLKMFQIIAPFVSEAIYLNLREQFDLKPISISHYSWPQHHDLLIDKVLEADVEEAFGLIQAALNAREKAKLGLRWPIKEIVVESRNKDVVKVVNRLKEIILKQTNAKEIRVVDNLPEVKLKVKPEFGKIGPAFGALSPYVIAKLTMDSPQTILSHIDKENFYPFTVQGKEVKITRDMIQIEREVSAKYKEAQSKNAMVYVNVERNEELEAEGYARELMRNIQQLRKNAGFHKSDDINLAVKVSEQMKKMLEKFKLDIREKVGADKLDISLVEPSKKFEHHGEFSVKQEKFVTWFDKA